jgi:hypothetical protein
MTNMLGCTDEKLVGWAEQCEGKMCEGREQGIWWGLGGMNE